MTLGLNFILACIGLALLLLIGICLLIRNELRKPPNKETGQPWLDQMEDPEDGTWPPKDGRDKEQS